ncbi:MAG: hypothetical protein J1E01_08180 [Acetatifactor sp.]|nr:hypothetical protein [Acetatifactor sp.]
MKQTVKEKALQVLQKTVEKEVRRLDVKPDGIEWPPTCSFLIHQPKRPDNQRKS